MARKDWEAILNLIQTMLDSNDYTPNYLYWYDLITRIEKQIT